MDAYQDLSDIALMVKVREGDEDAFKMLHERYQRRLLNFFYGMSRNAATANELCQECFLRIWKVRARYRVASTFPAYLFGIARMVWREKCREYYRDRALLSQWNQPELLSSGTFYQAQCNEMQAHILSALQQLPEEQRMVLVMRTLHGLSIEDIACAMDCPTNTVRSRKILGFKRLKHLLKRVFNDANDRSIQETKYL